MLSITKFIAKPRPGLFKQAIPSSGLATRAKSTLNDQPNEVETKISDTSDPNRSPFFQYSWGSWMKNDKIEKAKRQTKFSIEGATSLIESLASEQKNPANVDSAGEPLIKPPVQLNDGSQVLTQNLTSRILGDDLVQDSGPGRSIKSISSIHEGKHHRVYMITLVNDKELVLRIPYKLENEFAISQKIKSEVATMDFMSLKLGLNVPKIVSYGANKVNHLQSPFILMEHIKGDLLMKQWDPLISDEDPNAKDKLLEVIRPLSEFQEKVLSVPFNKFGSLYFTDDVEGDLQRDAAYDNEDHPLLSNRWKIGPSTEKVFFSGKNKLSDKQILQHSGPWDKSKPDALITSVADIQLENLRTRLGLAQADSSSKVESIDVLNKLIKAFENLKTMAPLLINSESTAIPNPQELFKPRLFVPDLDPLNVIVKDGVPFFVDFEYSTIKPFIYTSYPGFVSYQGVKIYNLQEDIPNYNELDEVEKQQYQFMYYKTRNERLWELELNSRRHDLIAIASPHIKALKSPYIQALDFKSDMDYLYIEGSIMQLQGVWEAYVVNLICNSKENTFPIKYDEEFVKEFQTELQHHQTNIASTPFTATGGWVPQDMFDKLREGGVIVPDGGDGYKVDTEKVMQESA